MKLKVLLWGLGFIIKKNFKKFEQFRELFTENSLDFAISVNNTNIGKRISINKDGVSTGKNVDDAELKIKFNDTKEAYAILTSKDKNAFMQGIQDKKISIDGNFNKIPFLQKIMGKLRT